jgi:antitoxin component YwqK of YwqJK toxin-antitoxin module
MAEQISETRHETGVLKETCPLKDGKPHGEVLSYDPAGALLLRAHAVEGVLQGPATTFNADRSIAHTSNFKDGKLAGEMQVFVAGKVKAKLPYKEGLLEGEAVFFDEIGLVSSRALYKGGLLDGESSWFDASGQVLKRAIYRQGKLHGPVADFFPNGQPREVTHYANDLLDGERATYHDNGKLIERVHYKDGRPLSEISAKRSY